MTPIDLCQLGRLVGDWTNQTLGERVEACRTLLVVHGYINERTSEAIKRTLKERSISDSESKHGKPRLQGGEGRHEKAKA